MFKLANKRVVFIPLIFFVFFLVKSELVYALNCPSLESYIRNAAEKTGLLTNCPQNNPVEVMDAMFRQESSCANPHILAQVPSVDKCIVYKKVLCDKGLHPTGGCTEEGQRKECQRNYDGVSRICQKIGTTDCLTSKDYGMGWPQFQFYTWDNFERKGLFKENGITNYPSPWDYQDAAMAMAIYLKERGFCSNPEKAIISYNGSSSYLDKIKNAMKNVGEWVATTYGKIEEKITELREYKRKLEIQYPEILGGKPEEIGVGLDVYVSYIISFVFIISGFLLFGIVVWSGILFLTSSGEPAKIFEARKKLMSAFTGTILLLSVFLVINYINPEIINIKNISLREPSISEKGTPKNIPPEEEKSEISEEISPTQSIQKGLWEEKRTAELKSDITNFENFLKSEFEVNLTFNRISDLNKYLKYLSEECQCSNLKAYCTKPWDWSLPVGCLGDPCEKETREKIKKSFDANEGKMKDLLSWQKTILEKKSMLQEELRKLSSLEEEINNCQAQMEAFNFNKYAQEKSSPKEVPKGSLKFSEIENYYTAQDDPLTFYCPAGGTNFETTEKRERVKIMYPSLTCPQEIQLGEFISESREQAVIVIVKLEELNYWIEEMVKKMRDMNDLVSQCSEKNCSISCACVPNPCYECCAPIPCTLCVPLCHSQCLQAVGMCNGTPCPRNKISKTAQDIKKAEDEIFLSIQEITSILSNVPSLFNNLEKPFNLINLQNKILNCQKGGLDIFSCQDAIGGINFEKEISQCNPESFYCCVPPTDPPKKIKLTAYPPLYVPPDFRQTFPPLPAISNCPKDWTCSSEVTQFKQYNEASPVLKEFLSCLRDGLNKLKQEKELTSNLGKIVSISDSKLQRSGQNGTCTWDSGPLEPNGCSHTYQILKNGKKTISCHYGGTECWPQRLSYAVDLSLESPLEKRYVHDIIKSAKECEPRVWIDVEGKGEILHLSLGAIYGCSCQ